MIIKEYLAQAEEDEKFDSAIESRNKLREAEAEKQKANYQAKKALVKETCKTCGCQLSPGNKSGFCRKHVKQGLSNGVKAPTKYVKYKTYYGVKNEDIMNHGFYQGGFQS